MDVDAFWREIELHEELQHIEVFLIAIFFLIYPIKLTSILTVFFFHDNRKKLPDQLCTIRKKLSMLLLETLVLQLGTSIIDWYE